MIRWIKRSILNESRLVQLERDLLFERQSHTMTAMQLRDTVQRLNALKEAWGELLRRHNALLDRAGEPTSAQFSKEEIRIMVRLCHPDRHAGKESAVRITQKLLSMR